MTQFETLPLSATQANDDDIDPGFLVPDYGNVIPPFDVEIDPDFSVMPPYPDGVIPDRPYPEGPAYPPFYPPFFPTPMPCLFCNTNHWARGSIRFLNAATGYNAFTIYIDNRPVYSNLNFPELTRYQHISQGYHRFSVVGNGYTYVQKSMYVGDGMATIAVINSSTGLDLTSIADTTCPTPNANACFRVCNLAYYSGPVNTVIGNVYFNSTNFNQAASFSSMGSGTYTVNVARSAQPQNTLVSTTVTLRPGRTYTLYVLNWSPTPDTIQTLLVEDRRN